MTDYPATAATSIHRAIDRHIREFVKRVEDDVRKIDVSEFVKERSEAYDLARILKTLLSLKMISPPMDSDVMQRIIERCEKLMSRLGEPTS